MEELSLEKEFEIYKKLHKISILTAKLTTFYDNIQHTGITIPDFLLEKPEKMAEREVISLMGNDLKKFEYLYNEAWQEYAEVLP